jgi:hypothetical protein
VAGAAEAELNAGGSTGKHRIGFWKRKRQGEENRYGSG